MEARERLRVVGGCGQPSCMKVMSVTSVQLRDVVITKSEMYQADSASQRASHLDALQMPRQPLEGQVSDFCQIGDFEGSNTRFYL
jgi:hypothetical protein